MKLIIMDRIHNKLSQNKLLSTSMGVRPPLGGDSEGVSLKIKLSPLALMFPSHTVFASVCSLTIDKERLCKLCVKLCRLLDKLQKCRYAKKELEATITCYNLGLDKFLLSTIS